MRPHAWYAALGSLVGFVVGAGENLQRYRDTPFRDVFDQDHLPQVAIPSRCRSREWIV